MQKQTIKNDDELKSSFKTTIINPTNNEYPVLVDDRIIDYNFQFPLQGTQFNEFESSQVFSASFGQEYSLNFNNCDFENDVILYFHGIKANRNVRFTNCHFKKNVSIQSFKNIITFSNCTFHEIINAENATIEGKLRFWECQFIGDVNFRNTRFEGLVDFWRSKFYKKTIFYKTDFLNTVVFSAAHFKENVLFTYTLIDKLILLRGTIIEKGLDLSLAIIRGKLGLFEFKLHDYDGVEFISDENRYENAVSRDAIIPINNKRETFRILKDISESQKNLSESLKFKAIEKEVLRRELINQYQILSGDSWHEILRVKVNNVLDRFNLWLNKLSNDHGDSYGRAFIFILIVGWLLFYCSLLASDQYYFTLDTKNWQFGEGVKLFLEFLNPIHKWDYIDKKEQSNVWFYLFDFIGKMSVGYGIYQFVQAFRKYK